MPVVAGFGRAMAEVERRMSVASSLCIGFLMGQVLSSLELIASDLQALPGASEWV